MSKQYKKFTRKTAFKTHLMVFIYKHSFTKNNYMRSYETKDTGNQISVSLNSLIFVTEM